jgi:hypothetical protein
MDRFNIFPACKTKNSRRRRICSEFVQLVRNEKPEYLARARVCAK